jgi:hypothetical protein
MLGRWIFGLVMLVVGLLYLWLAWMATFGNAATGSDIGTSALGLVLFLAIGGAAGFAGVSLLRQKRR